ncbi:hypothetical protein K4K54_005218 [Colletotrichum sp. SAR 10_86]|nr:hypothetical protein K4K52_009284 [Colletotrichum sp. SAR 10_76]KAI8235777.1 hypothetical protein K4K54_005218 [Colletotrichum sp. SAR 10_86]KAI8255585.1 hypothetical protein K4K53_007886 [Colletotrichum sp. SAR 10_77]
MPTPMNQTAIPSVTNLRKQLGYDDAKRKIFHEFKNAMLSSRDVFVTDEGLRDLESLEDENPPGLRSARERSRTVRAQTVDKGPNESELTDDASGYSGISRDPYLVPQSPDLGAQTPTVASRSSTRQRKARREPEWATEEQYRAAGESPEHPSSLGSIDNNHGAPDGATFVTPTRPTVEDAPQEDPVNDFIDEWTMQQNADTEAILTTTDIPKDRAMALNTTREEEAAERPDVALGVLGVHPSTRALMSEPVVPEETAAKAGSQRGDNAESNHVDPETVVAQPKFTYTIITHYPKYRERHWKPKSGFGNKTLSELLTEFPAWVQLSDVEELQFLMETSNAEVEGVIEVGQEEQFEEMKAKFEKAIRMEIARSTTSGQVLVRIGIDVRTGRDPKEEEMDIENISFSWS